MNSCPDCKERPGHIVYNGKCEDCWVKGKGLDKIVGQRPRCMAGKYRIAQGGQRQNTGHNKA